MIFGGSFLSLPEGISNHIMNSYFEEDNKVTEAVTLTLTHKCFSTFLPPVRSGKIKVFSYTLPPFHRSGALNLGLPGVLERYQSFGSMSSGATEGVGAPLRFLHKVGSNNPRVSLDSDMVVFLILTISPPC
ncbi:hypothetical protein E3U43_009255 [Larimichthys crocea]|uniref:Uncharacterized protein n=1 Tax=Larimichthys crocea TaxID=215358 RepID=A0ACD3RXE8_LARCR|nr:hypothetical protein E3U43_009255 [Larimichthys crocea]